MHSGQANLIDLLICALLGSEAASRITLPGLQQQFHFYSDRRS